MVYGIPIQLSFDALYFELSGEVCYLIGRTTPLGVKSFCSVTSKRIDVLESW